MNDEFTMQVAINDNDVSVVVAYEAHVDIDPEYGLYMGGDVHIDSREANLAVVRYDADGNVVRSLRMSPLIDMVDVWKWLSDAEQIKIEEAIDEQVRAHHAHR